jgi:hypothetical protein
LACVIDQGSITKRKALGGVPCGRITPGQQVHIFNVTELDLRTRKTTGRSYLRIFGRHTAEVFKKIICCLVELGVPPDVAQGIADDRTPVWLDDHPSYSFFALLEHNGYDVVKVSHKNRVFRNNDAQGSTSNAAEGEVSRYKAFFKAYNLRVPRDGDYGLYLAEFMWRRAQLSEAAGVPERRWRDFAFWRIVSTFGEVGKAELVKLQAGGRRRELVGGRRRLSGSVARLLEQEALQPLLAHDRGLRGGGGALRAARRRRLTDRPARESRLLSGHRRRRRCSSDSRRRP